MRIRRVFGFWSAVLLLSAFAPRAHATFSEDFPGLSKLTFSETESRIYMGFGMSPFGILRNKASYSLSLIQVHWMRDDYDIEIFNASYGATLAADTPVTNLKTVLFYTAPKKKIFRSISAGPLLGLEFISFPEVIARIGNGTFFTPLQPFSTQKFIFGVAFSETFKVGEKSLLKANQLLYKQTYSPLESSVTGWNYYYDDNALNRSQDAIAPGWVFVLNFSLLY
jgi:hypothetical protein